MLPTDLCAPPDDLAEPPHPVAAGAAAWLPIRKRILLGSSSPSPSPATPVAAAAAVSDKLLTAATYYCLATNPHPAAVAANSSFSSLAMSPMMPPPPALVSLAAGEVSAADSDGELGSECGELSIDESRGDDQEDIKPLAAADIAEHRGESDAAAIDCSSNSSRSSSSTESSRNSLYSDRNHHQHYHNQQHTQPTDDEVKVLKIVLRRRRQPWDAKQLQLLTGGRALWLSTGANGRTVVRTYPQRAFPQLRHAGQSVRAGVIHHSSNPDRHLTYYYLPRSAGGGGDSGGSRALAS
jgi:hypothetical protein